MPDHMSPRLTFYVEHGREQEAATFYATAFGAHETKKHYIDNRTLTGVELELGGLPITVAGSNPKREQSPALGGPFYPKAPGAVSAVLTLPVADLDDAVQHATAAGATVRDQPSPSSTGGRAATVFDPFGHMWALIEDRAAAQGLAA